jgi:hypothetical protein
VAVVDDVREALEQTVPDYSDRSGDWAGVLAMAHAGEGHHRGAGAFQGRRRRPLVALAAAVLVVVVGAASAFGTMRDLLSGGDPDVLVQFFPSEGKRGSFTLRLLTIEPIGGDVKRRWRIVVEPDAPYSVPGTGQYAQITGRGRIVRMGGHAQAWNAGLVGFVTRPGEAKQRVVITLKGRPKGVFVLTPLESGVLKRDSGTQRKTAGFG